MYKTVINGNVLICDYYYYYYYHYYYYYYYYYKKAIREQQSCYYSHYLKLQNLLSVSLNFKQTCKKTFPF